MSSAKVNRVCFSEVATFSTAAPDASSTWTHLPAIDVALPKVVQGKDSAQEANSRGNGSASYATHKEGSGAFQTRIYTGTKGLDGAGGDTSPSSYYLEKLISNYYGSDGSAAFTGTTVASSSGPGQSSALKVASASNMAVGMPIICGNEARVIKAISGADITLDSDLATAANYANGAVVYGLKYWTPTLGNYAKCLYFNYEEDGHSWLVGPANINDFKITNINARNGMRYDFGFAGYAWVDGVTPSSFTDNRATFSGQPLVAVGAVVSINGVDTNCDQVTFTPGVAKSPIVATAGTNGLAGWENTEQGMPVLAFTEYYSSTRMTQYQAVSEVPVRLQVSVGSTNAAKARGTLFLFMPNAHVETEEVELNGQRALKTTITGHDPSAADVVLGITKSHVLGIAGGI